MSTFDRLLVLMMIASAAVNAAIYAAKHGPISLGAAVFCGLLALVVTIAP